jgi:hypothetical protein
VIIWIGLVLLFAGVMQLVPVLDETDMAAVPKRHPVAVPRPVRTGRSAYTQAWAMPLLTD